MSPECHPLHYLQMAGEKLGKAARKGLDGSESGSLSHVAFSKLPKLLRRRDCALALGWDSFDSYKQFLRQSAPLIRQIETLNPAVGPGAGPPTGWPNVEYPWRLPGACEPGGWTAPAEYGFGIVDRFHHPEGRQLIVFVERLIDRFDAVFDAATA